MGLSHAMTALWQCVAAPWRSGVFFICISWTPSWKETLPKWRQGNREITGKAELHLGRVYKLEWVQSHIWGGFSCSRPAPGPNWGYLHSTCVTILFAHSDHNNGCHLTSSWGLFVVSRMEQWKNKTSNPPSQSHLYVVSCLSVCSLLWKKKRDYVFQCSGNIYLPTGGFVPLNPVSDKHCKLNVSSKKRRQH